MEYRVDLLVGGRRIPGVIYQETKDFFDRHPEVFKYKLIERIK